MKKRISILITGILLIMSLSVNAYANKGGIPVIIFDLP